MPQDSEYEPVILGTATPEQRGRVLDFLQTFPARNRLQQVAVIPAKEWAETKELMKVYRGGPYAFTVPEARRTYLNDAAFDGKPGSEWSIEWALAHETTHLNDPRAPALQQQFDTQIDGTARESLGRWLDDPHVTAYRKLKAAARHAFENVQPESAPVAPDLQEALSGPTARPRAPFFNRLFEVGNVQE